MKDPFLHIKDFKNKYKDDGVQKVTVMNTSILHLIKWNFGSKLKEMGGLWIGNLIMRNTALLAKWLWQFSLEKKLLWVSIIRSKYGVEGGRGSKRVTTGSCRSPWRFLPYGLKSFRCYVSYEVGDGRRIRFWEDHWRGDQSFMSYFRDCIESQIIVSIASLASLNISNSVSFWNLLFRRNFNDDYLKIFSLEYSSRC